MGTRQPIAGRAAAEPAGRARVPPGVMRWLQRQAVQLVATSLLALGAAGVAQAFDPNADGFVNTLALQVDGRILASGSFDTIGGVPRNGFARIDASGMVDAAYAAGVSSAASAVALQADGKVLVAGQGVRDTGGLLRINGDGSVDAGFVDAMTSGNNRIDAVLPLPDGRILIGGTFASVGDQPRFNIARLNPDGSLDATFDAGNIAAAARVLALAVESDGDVLVGGTGLLVRVTGTGAPDLLQPLPNVAAWVYTLHVQADGRIVVGAAVAPLDFGGGPRGQLARLNADGSVDAAFAPAIDNSVLALARQPDGKWLVGGGFLNVGGQARRYIARLQADGTLDPSFSDPALQGQVQALLLQADGKVVVGGTFAFNGSASGLTRNRLARLHPDGRLDNGHAGQYTVTPFAGENGSISPAAPQATGEGARLSFAVAPDPGFVVATLTGCGGSRIGDVYTTSWIFGDCTVVASFVSASEVIYNPESDNNVERIVVQADGRSVVGGWFGQIGGLQRSKLARLDESAGAAEASYPQGTVNIAALALQPDGKVLVGDSTGLRRYHVDGSVDTGFNVTLSSDPRLSTIVVLPNGMLLIGGLFESVDGVPRNSIARLHADGALDPTFDPGVGPDNVVYALAQQADGRIVVGGGFWQFNNSERQGLVRLEADGALDEDFSSLFGDVYAIHQQADGRLILGGTELDLGDGQPAGTRLLRITAQGVRDPTFDTIVADGVVETIVAQPDGKLLVAGAFSQVNGLARGNLVRLSPQGTVDAAFDARTNSRVRTVALQPDGKILIGGYFHQVNGVTRRGIARLKADGGIDIESFLVTPVAGANGTIAPNAPQAVEPGQVLAFTVVPDPGYVIGNVSGCGGSLQGLTYTTGPIVGHCAVTADFLLESVNYIVTPDAGLNGALAPATPQSVLFAQSTQFDVVPDAGYFIASVTGCGGSLAGTVYSTNRILADCSVSARFTTPEALTVTDGDTQITAVGTRFELPLTVRIADAAGAPVVGVPVAFSAPASGATASLSSATALTDAGGFASVTARAGSGAGAYGVSASVNGLTATFALRNEAVDHGGLEFKVTVSTEPPPACGTRSEIEAVAGQQLNYCFSITNTSDLTLRYHTLTLASFGFPTLYNHWPTDRIFTLLDHPVAPGETWRYHRLITVGTQDQTPSFTWSATATPPGYDIDDSSAVPFTDISATGTALQLGALGVHELEPLPFPITFLGEAFLDGDISRLCVHNSGTLALRVGDQPCERPDIGLVPPLVGDNAPLPQGAHGIAPYWDALGDRGTVYHAVVGNAPQRRLIVQWDGMDHAAWPNPANGITFQAQIEEGSGRIVFVYGNTAFDVVADPSPDNGGSATIGLTGYLDWRRGSELPPFEQYSHQTAAVHDGLAITWTPTDVPRYAAADVIIDVGTPRLALAPGSVTARTAPGTQVERNLVIGNTGDLDLEWSLREAAAKAHFPPQGSTYVPPSTAEAAAPLFFPAPHDDGAFALAGLPQPPLLAVPAYGQMLENNDTRRIAFDASRPSDVVQELGIANSGQLNGGDFVGDDFSRMYVFDAAFPDALGFYYSFTAANVIDGSLTPIGLAIPQDPDTLPAARWSGLAWDRSTDTLFALATGIQTFTGVFCSAPALNDLYRIDVGTGAATRIAPIVADRTLCITDLAVSADGAMYGFDALNDALVAIDKDSGESAVIGWLGFNLSDNEPRSADFDDSTGTLYLAADGGTHAVDLVTGLATRLGDFPHYRRGFSVVSVAAMGIALSGGNCVDPASVPWLSLNQGAGITTAGSEVPVQVRLDASGLAEGRHEATLCLHTNDRSQSLVQVPVTLTVASGGEGETIFADDFESSP